MVSVKAYVIINFIIFFKQHQCKSKKLVNKNLICVLKFPFLKPLLFQVFVKVELTDYRVVCSLCESYVSFMGNAKNKVF